MEYRVTVRGITPILMHSGTAGLDSKHPANIEKAEITAKRGRNKTAADEARLRTLDCATSLWLDVDDTPTIPPGAFRACIENAARKSKQGPAVREGLVVADVESFDYDEKMYGKTVEELCEKTQFTVPVIVNRGRILRTRAKFDEWSCTFVVEVDDELIDQPLLQNFLDIGGRRVGIGDWRPQTSGMYGRFEVSSIEAIGKPLHGARQIAGSANGADDEKESVTMDPEEVEDGIEILARTAKMSIRGVVVKHTDRWMDVQQQVGGKKRVYFERVNSLQELV